jgi:hypothetical protein
MLMSTITLFQKKTKIKFVKTVKGNGGLEQIK